MRRLASPLLSGLEPVSTRMASLVLVLYAEEDGEVLIGPGGWRGYAIIDDAERIPDLTRLLHFQLWEIGEGKIVVGKAGHG